MEPISIVFWVVVCGFGDVSVLLAGIICRVPWLEYITHFCGFMSPIGELRPDTYDLTDPHASNGEYPGAPFIECHSRRANAGSVATL